MGMGGKEGWLVKLGDVGVAKLGGWATERDDWLC
jgi:hypothetical protein